MRMPKARQLPSGSWFARVTVNGRTVCITDRTEALVIKKVAQLKATTWAEAHHPSGITVGEAVDEYIRGREGILSPSTLKAYHSYREHRFKTLMPRRIGSLSSAMVQQAVALESRQTSPKTVRNAWGLVYASIQEQNPDIHFKVTLPKKAPPKGKAIDPNVLREIFRLIRGTRYELPILLDAFLGLRRSELFALRKADFNFTESVVTISRAYVQAPDGTWVEREATKTAAGYRTVHVDPALMRLVEAVECDERLFSGIHPNTLYSYLNKLTEAHGLPHVRVHDFRHTFASVSHLLGVPDHYTMQAGGWASRPVMDTVYTHALDSAQAQFASRVADYYRSVCSTLEDEKSTDCSTL